MREEIKTIKEMTDSREMLESKTSPAITIFIVILLSLIIVALIWSFFGEIHNVAKANGIVRPNEKVSTIQPSVFGRTEQIYYYEGMHVSEGDLLLVLDHEELISERDYRYAEYEEAQQQLEALYAYKASVQSLENMFDKESEKERVYYDWVEQFLLNYNQLKLDLEASQINIEQSKKDLAQSKETLQLNLQMNEQQFKREKEVLQKEINKISVELEHEKVLRDSIMLGELIDSNLEQKRTAEFEYYQLQFEKLINEEETLRVNYERSKQLGERFVSRVQLENEKSQVEAAQRLVASFKNELLLNIESRIKEYNDQLEAYHTSFEALETEHKLTSNHEVLLLQNLQLNEQIQRILEQEEHMTQLHGNALQKFKMDKVVEINMMIEEQERNLKLMREGVQQLDFSIEKRYIKSPISGTVNIQKNINTGDYIQSGETLLSIIPTNESKYKMSIAVPNHEVGKIKLGDQVDLNFDAFPKQSYGSLTGTISLISSDAVIQQDGFSYYIVEAQLSNEPLINRRKEQAEIRVGMTAEAYVITDTPKIIHYVLEKINLRD